MNIRLGKQWEEKIDFLRKEYFRAKGSRPISRTILIQQLIDDSMRDADPPEYRTTGFERLD